MCCAVQRYLPQPDAVFLGAHKTSHSHNNLVHMVGPCSCSTLGLHLVCRSAQPKKCALAFGSQPSIAGTQHTCVQAWRPGWHLMQPAPRCNAWRKKHLQPSTHLMSPDITGAPLKAITPLADMTLPHECMQALSGVHTHRRQWKRRPKKPRQKSVLRLVHPQCLPSASHTQISHSSGSSTLSLSSQQNQLPRVSNQSPPSSSSRATKPLLHDPSRPHDQKPGNAVCSIPGKKPPSLPLFSPILLPTQGDASGAAVIELTPQPCDCWHVPIPTHSRRKLNDPLAQQQLPAWQPYPMRPSMTTAQTHIHTRTHKQCASPPINQCGMIGIEY